MSELDDVRRMALALPEVEEGTSYGTPAFKVRKRLFLRLRDDDRVLVAWRESEEEKEALVESEPRKFFTTSHYDGYPMVLVRLGEVGPGELEDVAVESWLCRAPERLARRFLEERDG